MTFLEFFLQFPSIALFSAEIAPIPEVELIETEYMANTVCFCWLNNAGHVMFYLPLQFALSFSLFLEFFRERKTKLSN